MTNQAAQAAKLIRKEIKENVPSVKVSVTSKTYSMGSNVNVTIVSEASIAEVNKIRGSIAMLVSDHSASAGLKIPATPTKTERKDYE